MGEYNTLFAPKFNHSLHVEARPERLTANSGAVILREILERLHLTDWLCKHLHDPRRPELITHPLGELLQTAVILLAQGWRDQDDADFLRHDPVLRLAVSARRGLAPLKRSAIAQMPDGLASQPTLSRLIAALGQAENRAALRESLLVLAARRVKVMRHGRRLRTLTLDIDSLPIVVHGHQPKSDHNGLYHARIYHPLVALAAELGDLLDVQLRPGRAYTAAGACDFILPLIDRVEKQLCKVADVRMDAGFPEETLLAQLEARGTAYVARVRNNRVLNRMAKPFLRRPMGRPPAQPRTWTHELTYRAHSWSRERRVVLVVLERPDELFLHHFWLVTNWSAEQMDGASLLEHYRQRGTAESHLGELKSVIAPALSSAPRPKTSYRGVPPRSTKVGPCDAYAHNEAILLLNALAYEITHITRVLIERAQRTGWSLRRVRERVLRVAGRVVLHGRYATLIVCHAAADLWSPLWSQLQSLQYAGP